MRALFLVSGLLFTLTGRVQSGCADRCAPQCTVSSECAAVIGPGWSCVAGRCSPSDAGPAADAGP